MSYDNQLMLMLDLFAFVEEIISDIVDKVNMPREEIIGWCDPVKNDESVLREKTVRKLLHSPVLNNKNSSSVSIHDIEDIAMEKKLKGLVQRAESPVSIPEEEENEYTKAWKA